MASLFSTKIIQLLCDSSYTHFDKKPDGIEVVKVADIPALVRALFK